MIPYLDSTLVLSQKRINLVRQAYGRWAIGNVENDGFRTIRNPFNYQKCEEEANATPLYLKIPEFVESEQTLQFMGFDHVTARLIWRKYRSTSEHRPLAEDLIWCALQYLAYVEAQATGREGITDQDLIKERMGFHKDSTNNTTTFLHIDKNCSPSSPFSSPTYTTTATTTAATINPYVEEPRVIFWITTIISRRYDFIYHLEETIGSRLRILHWSHTTYARNFDNYSPAALRDGVDSWFDYIAGLKKALEPLNGGMENVAIDLIAFMLERFCANV